MQVLASERMIEVNDHLILLYLDHLAKETVSVRILEGNYRALENVFMVEVIVYGEYALVHIYDAFSLIFAVSLVLRDGEIEVIAHCERFDGILKVFQRYAHSTHKVKRLVGFSSLYEMLLIAVQNVKFIADGDILVLDIIHFLCLLIINY